MPKILSLLLTSIFFTGCGNKFDDEVTSITKCTTSAQLLGGEYQKKMAAAAEWKAPQIRLVEFDPDRIKYYAKMVREVANSDGTPNKEKLLGWYNSKYCLRMIEDFNEFKK